MVLFLFQEARAPLGHNTRRLRAWREREKGGKKGGEKERERERGEQGEAAGFVAERSEAREGEKREEREEKGRKRSGSGHQWGSRQESRAAVRAARSRCWPMKTSFTMRSP